MTEVEKLRALLAEARVLMRHGPDCPIVRCDCRMRETALRIDAALAEPVEEESQYGIREDRDSLRVEIKRLERERDEARAEVERLGRLLTDSTIIIRETVQILASVVRQINGEKP